MGRANRFEEAEVVLICGRPFAQVAIPAPASDRRRDNEGSSAQPIVPLRFVGRGC